MLSTKLSPESYENTHHSKLYVVLLCVVLGLTIGLVFWLWPRSVKIENPNQSHTRSTEKSPRIVSRDIVNTPDIFPEGFPIMDSARIISSSESQAGNGHAAFVERVYQVDGNAQEVYNLYKNFFEKKSWNLSWQDEKKDTDKTLTVGKDGTVITINIKARSVKIPGATSQNEQTTTSEKTVQIVKVNVAKY